MLCTYCTITQHSEEYIFSAVDTYNVYVFYINFSTKYVSCNLSSFLKGFNNQIQLKYKTRK